MQDLIAASLSTRCSIPVEPWFCFQLAQRVLSFLPLHTLLTISAATIAITIIIIIIIDLASIEKLLMLGGFQRTLPTQREGPSFTRSTGLGHGCCSVLGGPGAAEAQCLTFAQPRNCHHLHRVEISFVIPMLIVRAKEFRLRCALGERAILMEAICCTDFHQASKGDCSNGKRGWIITTPDVSAPNFPQQLDAGLWAKLPLQPFSEPPCWR